MSLWNINCDVLVDQRAAVVSSEETWGESKVSKAETSALLTQDESLMNSLVALQGLLPNSWSEDEKVAALIRTVLT